MSQDTREQTFRVFAGLSQIEVKNKTPTIPLPLNLEDLKVSVVTLRLVSTYV